MHFVCLFSLLVTYVYGCQYFPSGDGEVASVEERSVVSGLVQRVREVGRINKTLTLPGDWCTVPLVEEGAEVDSEALCASVSLGVRGEGRVPKIATVFLLFDEAEMVELSLYETEASTPADARSILHLPIVSTRTFTGRPLPPRAATILQAVRGEEATSVDGVDDEFVGHVHDLLAAPNVLPYVCAQEGGDESYSANWQREHAARSCAAAHVRALVADGTLADDDLVLLADADELLRAETWRIIRECDVSPYLGDGSSGGLAFNLDQLAYTFYYRLRARSPWPGYPDWPGPMLKRTRDFLAHGPGNVRFAREKPTTARLHDAGWHLSPFPFGDAGRIVTKLESWAHQEARRKAPEFRATDRWQAALESCSHCDHIRDTAYGATLPRHVQDFPYLYEGLLDPAWADDCA